MLAVITPGNVPRINDTVENVFVPATASPNFGEQLA